MPRHAMMPLPPRFRQDDAPLADADTLLHLPPLLPLTLLPRRAHMPQFTLRACFRQAATPCRSFDVPLLMLMPPPLPVCVVDYYGALPR